MIIEQSGEPPIPTKFAKAITIEISGKQRPNPPIAKVASWGILPI